MGVWFVWFGLVDLVWLIWFGLVGLVWFGLVGLLLNAGVLFSRAT